MDSEVVRSREMTLTELDGKLRASGIPIRANVSIGTNFRGYSTVPTRSSLLSAPTMIAPRRVRSFIPPPAPIDLPQDVFSSGAFDQSSSSKTPSSPAMVHAPPPPRTPLFQRLKNLSVSFSSRKPSTPEPAIAPVFVIGESDSFESLDLVGGFQLAITHHLTIIFQNA